MHDGGTAQTNKKTFDDSQFDTKNVEVKKVVDGKMADKNHEFPVRCYSCDNGRKYFLKEKAATTAMLQQDARILRDPLQPLLRTVRVSGFVAYLK